jgi:Mce-associated membrane protein
MSAPTVTKKNAQAGKGDGVPPQTSRSAARVGGLVARGRRGLIVTSVVVLVVLALIGYIVVGALALQERSAVEAGQAAAEPAARSAVERMLTYDSADLERTRAAIDEVSTGSFHDQFGDVFARIVAPNATQQRARSSAVVRESGVVSAEEGRVVVLLFLNQSTSSSQLPADRIDTIQTRVTMTEVDGRWLASGLDQV